MEIINYCITEEEIKNISDLELSHLLMHSDKDRNELEFVEHIYWMCVKEINRRIEMEEESAKYPKS